MQQLGPGGDPGTQHVVIEEQTQVTPVFAGLELATNGMRIKKKGAYFLNLG